MKETLRKFRILEKKDQLILFIMFSTIGYFIMTVIKFILSLTIPSLCFFVNGGFCLILAICRLLTIRKYNKIKETKDKETTIREEYKCYLQNGVMLIWLGIMYFFVSSYMYYNGTNTTMHEYITYLVALIAFISKGTAIYGRIKYKKNKDPIIKGIKITNTSLAKGYLFLLFFIYNYQKYYISLRDIWQ